MSVATAELPVASTPSPPPQPAPLRPARLATRPPSEQLSPFLAWSDTERGESLVADLEAQPPSLLGDLLRAPERLVDRLLEPKGAAELTTSALVVLAASASVTGLATATALGSEVLRPALSAPLSLLVAVAAALGPITAVGLVMGVRVPWAQLAASLVMAVAAGALATASLSPFTVVLFRLDREWAGPLASVIVFALSGLLAGQRIGRILRALALASLHASLGPGAALTRMATVLLGFTTAMAVWAFQALW
jgi:hypothetical protein